MPKWRVARDVAFHPAKSIKVATRRNKVKDELICDLAGGQEFVESRDVFPNGDIANWKGERNRSSSL